MVNERFLDWVDIRRGIDKICTEIYASGFRPEIIIGIPRGGLIPATMLSHRLNVARVETNNWFNNGYGCNGLQILVVDEICDTGKTFVKVKEKFPLAKYCALVHNLSCDNIFKDVHYTGIEIDKDEDKRWLVFPWEV